MASTSGSLTATGSVTLAKPSHDTHVTLQIAGTYGTVSFVIEGSLDGTNYSPVVAQKFSDGSLVSGTISPVDNSELLYVVPAPGLLYVRARVTAIASGTAEFTLTSASFVGMPNPQYFSGMTFGSMTLSEDLTLKNSGGVSHEAWDASDVCDLWANSPSKLEPDFHARATELFDDFIAAASTTASDVMTWTAVNDGSTGSPVYQDAANGVFNVVTAAADNDYAAYSSVNESWKFDTGKKLWFEARFRIAEATTNESTWWFGLSDTLTTGGMQANAAGPLASYDGALIWKTPETAMTVNFETSNAGTQNTLSAFATSVTNTWHRVGFYFDGTATTSTVTPYFHDGTSWTAGAAQNITLSGLEEMHVVFGVKAGPTAAAETLQVDYVRVVQLR